MTIAKAIAMNRFGLGHRPDYGSSDRQQAWLLDQLIRFDPSPQVVAAQPSRQAIASAFQSYRMDAKQFRNMRKNKAGTEDQIAMLEAQRKESRKSLQNIHMEAVDARLTVALNSDTDFAERLVHFWSNHFAISVEKPPVVALSGNYEFRAIRPHIMGKFSDLLFAAVQHPAMLLFLDQAQSVGPSSPMAKRISQRRGKQFGLNENLAREILELHTLGVRTGYDQSDVTELARALTGWTIAGFQGGPAQRRLAESAKTGDTVFIDAVHEPGQRRIMDKTYGAEGADQVKAILSDLAVHPATARHVAMKLARHFVSDKPPEKLVNRLEDDFLSTGGDLPSLYRTLVEAPEAWPTPWNGAQAKFKSPWEWLVSSLRALNVRDLPTNMKTAQLLRQLGQPVWKPGSPAGYADETATWAGSAALMRRVELAERIARRSADRIDARALAPQILPGVLANNTVEAVARAESPSQGLSLLLVSPEFLRR
ncbi:DUF1800 domain-containing protein [Parasphingorhabdus cellanae]|uniref:DUF1800 domain-containing protein n=1 Tax=Parasphingorhabdus cellanae TaxID=2806553 RepID=A0ABX7T961_9SPHN|nr:DUF1800 domain-containing protein [Parasphingorhabdus cellanae]QTD56772.1 DUF1800 domain-containing protein [Parasphingorhabdus cellanae]